MAANPYFEIQSGADKARFEVEEAATDVVVGRSSECKWAIPSSGVSRKHARIHRQGSEVTIEDLGSSNGTFVNSERLSGPRALRDRDLVRLGSVEMRFVIPEPTASVDATIARPPAEPTPVTPVAEPPPIAPPPPSASPPPGTSVPHTVSVGSSSTTRPASVDSAPSPAEKTAAREPTPPWVSAAGDGEEPSLVELLAIAAGSFLAVFALGALLIRFLL